MDVEAAARSFVSEALFQLCLVARSDFFADVRRYSVSVDDGLGGASLVRIELETGTDIESTARLLEPGHRSPVMAARACVSELLAFHRRGDPTGGASAAAACSGR